jgi:hypothetical protein
LTEPELKQHLQAHGLRDTSAYLQDLLEDEIKVVGAKNFIGGIWLRMCSRPNRDASVAS